MDEPQLKLDGSYGAGPLCELTIITRAGEVGEKEETFSIPYMLVNFTTLHAIDAFHLILGYKILKIERPSALKELGL